MTTLYTSDHEWLRIEGDVATVGVTDEVQELVEHSARLVCHDR